MGTRARLFFTNAPNGLDEILAARLRELEQKWSRFEPDSEVNAINAGAGEPVEVGPDTQLLVQRAVSASARTRGWFDPTLLNELVGAGYDRTFDKIADTGLGELVIMVHRGADCDQVQVHEWNAASTRIALDPSRGTVMVPSGVGFDAGGIGKGLAADLLADLALRSGADAAMIDLGGDIVVGGRAPESGWPIAVEDPFDRSTIAMTLRLGWGAVATSSRSRRRWFDGEAEQSHLIDPGTGTPTGSDAAACTVVAAECWLAESYAKAALLAGVGSGIDILEADHIEGLIFDADGEVHMTSGMKQYVT